MLFLASNQPAVTSPRQSVAARLRASAPTRRALLGLLALALALIQPGAARAQETPGNKAGVVIDFGDGVVLTACVDLGADGQATGEEMLHGAGFDVLIEYSSQGGAVCKIGAQGCDYPDQTCWCQCMSSPCVYWAYNHLADGQWVYSTLGASSYVLHAGDVDGWAWGAGTIAQGAQPPVVAFDQICAAPTATPSPTQTATPLPTATPTTAATVWVPYPTSTPTATPGNAATPTATWTPNPTATPSPTQAAATPTPNPSPTAMATPTETDAPAGLLSPTPTSTPSEPAGGATQATGPTAAATPGSPVAPGQGPTKAAGENGKQALYLPFLAHGAGLESLPPAGPGAFTDASTPQGAAVATPSPTATAAPAALVALPPAAAASFGASAQPAGGIPRKIPAKDAAARMQNAPFAVDGDSTLLTRAAPDPVFPAVLVLALAAALAAPRVLRLAIRASSPRALIPALERAVASARAVGVRQRPATRDAGRSSPTAGHSGWLSLAIYGLTAGIGLLALLQPFLLAALDKPSAGVSSPSAPLLVTILLALCFLALLFEIQGQVVSAKRIALLGVLVAINAVLRFVEVSIPGPGGFTPVFFLIVLTGYVFGGRFGFLIGALTMLVSGLITGGIGPWLPGQMFTAGWMGLLAPLARPLARLAGGRPNGTAEVVVLAAYAGLCGLFYGVVINLWFWPFMTGPADQYWQVGAGLADAVRRYAVYYAATSLVWDVFAVAGNVLLVGVFGAATLAALRRFHRRFDFELVPVGAGAAPAEAEPTLDRPMAPLGHPGVGKPARALQTMSIGEGRGQA